MTVELPITPAADTPARLGSRRFAVVFLFFAAAAVALGFGVNVVGNATELFPSKLRPSMGERAWKTRRIDEQVRRKAVADLVVMGSSRMMQVQPEYVAAVTGKRTFNYGVSAAGPVDFLAQLKYVVANHYAPRTILIGVDESAFAAVTSQYELQTVAHWGLFKEAPFPENVALLTRALGNVTPETTWNSAVNVLEGKVPRQRKLRRVDNVLLEDGYNIYVRRAQAADEGRPADGASAVEQARWAREIGRTRALDLVRTADAWRKRMGTGVASSGRRVLEPQARALELFDQFLTLARDNHVEVRVLLLPLHPEFERLALSPDMVEDRERLSVLLKQLCASRSATYKDFRQMASYGGSPDEWWDGSHQTPENLRRMTNAAFDRPPAERVVEVKSDGFVLRHLSHGKGAAITTLNSY